jgi:hypothetical protein
MSSFNSLKSSDGNSIINVIISYKYMNDITKRYSEFHKRHDLLRNSGKIRSNMK